MQFSQARFRTIERTLQIDPKAKAIRIDPDGNGRWVDVDYSGVPNFNDILQACQTAGKGKYFSLTITAGDVIISGGSRSSETRGSDISNRRYCVATKVSLELTH